MNGVHDLGGMHGFGPVVREPDAPVVHAPWEDRVQVMMDLARPALLGTLDGMRFAIESVAPVRHLAASYWERWLAALELGVLARGLATREELAARVAHVAAHPAAAPAGGARPGRPPLPLAAPGPAAAGAPGTAAPRAPAAARFGPGDRVTTRTFNPAGHTRLPRYARGRRGEIVRVHPPAALPDAVVLGLDPARQARQPVYAVRFAARELWGPDGHANDAVSLDAWEDYLEAPDGAAPADAAAGGAPAAAGAGGTPPPAPAAAPGLPPYDAINAAGPWWDGAALPPPAALTAAIESVLVEHGLVDRRDIDAGVAQVERERSVTPPPGARLVARAWLDAPFRARLLADASAAAAELGLAAQTRPRTVVLADAPRAHNVVVCTLCSCTGPLTGLKPTWYKSPAYRARVVLQPRTVLRGFGVDLPDDVEVRVWDTSAEHRYLVLPRRPAGTEGYGEDQLAALVTTDALLGVAVPRPA